MTVRASACNELADNPADVRKLLNMLHECELATNATSTLLKWFPSQGRKRHQAASREMYAMLQEVLNERRKTGRHEYDPMQALIDESYSDKDIIEVIA